MACTTAWQPLCWCRPCGVSRWTRGLIAMPSSMAYACTVSRRGTARRWCSCTGSPSSGTPGASDPGPRRGRLSGDCPRFARLQPVGQAAGHRQLSRRAPGRRRGRSDKANRTGAGHHRRPRLGRHPRLDLRHAPPGTGAAPGRHERAAPGHLPARAAHAGTARRSWYVFFFQVPRLPEWYIRRRNFQAIDRMLRDGPGGLGRSRKRTSGYTRRPWPGRGP